MSSEASHANPPPPIVAERLAPLQLLQCIGHGGTGSVWLAQHPDGAHCAVKWVPSRKSDGSPSANYEREWRAVQLFQTLANIPAGIIPIHDIMDVPGEGFAYTMPLGDAERPNWRPHPEAYRAKTLRSELTARRALPLDECIDIAGQLATAIAFFHRYNLVHRDIKPGNVIYLHDRPVLGDIGLLADTREAASYVGTPGYVPREQHGESAGDVYSLGVLLYEISTGRPATELRLAAREEADRDDPRFGRWLEILRKACSDDPRKRYQTMVVFIRDIDRLKTIPATGKRIRRWGWAMAAALCVAGGMIWGLSPLDRSRHQPMPTQEAQPGNFATTPLDQWDTFMWPEFFNALSNRIETVDHWTYITSPSGGGHWGLMQCYIADHVDSGIWLAQDRLTVKILLPDRYPKTATRDIFAKLFLQGHPPDTFRFVQPRHWGEGKTMTIALLNRPYRKQTPDGRLDMDATIQFLKEIEIYVREQSAIVNNSSELITLLSPHKLQPRPPTAPPTGDEQPPPETPAIRHTPTTNWIALPNTPGHKAPAEIILNIPEGTPLRYSKFGYRIFPKTFFMGATGQMADRLRILQDPNDTVVLHYLPDTRDQDILRLEGFTASQHSRYPLTGKADYQYDALGHPWAPVLWVPLSDTAPEHQAFPAQIWILPHEPDDAMKTAIFDNDVETFARLWRHMMPNAGQIIMPYHPENPHP